MFDGKYKDLLTVFPYLNRKKITEHAYCQAHTRIAKCHRALQKWELIYHTPCMINALSPDPSLHLHYLSNVSLFLMCAGRHDRGWICVSQLSSPYTAHINIGVTSIVGLPAILSSDGSQPGSELPARLYCLQTETPGYARLRPENFTLRRKEWQKEQHLGVWEHTIHIGNSPNQTKNIKMI